MKTKFVFISDMHLQEGDNDIVARSDKLVDYLSSSDEFDDLFFLFTGDIAQSGQTKQYNKASAFISRIIKSANNRIPKKNKKINILMVPGNHDINFNGEKRARTKILPMIAKCKKGDFLPIAEDKSKYSEFLYFANYNNCFKENFEYDIKVIETCGHKVQFNLLNSTFFSVYDPDGDIDEGVHILSQQAIDSLQKQEDVSFVFTMMHHGIEFFDSSIRATISTAIEDNSNLLLNGHEHLPSCGGKINLMGTTTTIRGGRFSDSSKIDSEFFIMDFDWGKKKYFIKQIVWDTLLHIYKQQNIQEHSIEKRQKNSEDFLRWLNEGDTMSGLPHINDYFVFPTLSTRVDGVITHHKDIQNVDEFVAESKEKQIIEISGSDLSGKTTLVKCLFNYYADNGKKPLIVAEEDMNRKPERALQFAFEREYSSNVGDFDAYMQIPKKQRIIFVEDIHLLAKQHQRDLFIKYLVEKFDCVIYTTALSVDFDLVNSLEQFILDQQLKVLRLRIEPFYKAKRKPLIKRVCECLGAESESIKIEKLAKKVESFISAQINVFDLSPQFIVMFTRSYILNLVKTDNANAFNAVFESNILATLNKHSHKTNINDLMQILQELAWFVHFNKKYPIGENDLLKIIDTYNQDHRTKISYQNICNELTTAKIIKIENASIQFVKKSYLAYFAARWLNRMLHRGEGESELKHVIDNLCYNLNSDIILFLTFLTESTVPLGIILESEREYTKNLLEFSIDSRNIACLFSDAPPKFNLPPPSDEDRNKRDTAQSQAERKMIEREELRTANIYDDSGQDDFLAQQMRLIKFLEIVSKALPNFFHLLKRDQQDAFVNEIYVLANKVIYFLFKPLDDHYDELVKEFTQIVSAQEIPLFKNEDDIKDFLYHTMGRMALITWDYCSGRLATDERSINALDDFHIGENTNYRIQNAIMHGTLNNFVEFAKKVDSIYEDKKVSNFAKYLLIRVFREYCLNNRVQYKGEAQKYIDKYLGGAKNLMSQRIGHTKKE